MSTHYCAYKEGKEIALAQTAHGWKPLIHWHGGYSDCPCHCDEHHYYNFDEFVDFVVEEVDRIEDEFGNAIAPFELIGKLQRFQESNSKTRHSEMSSKDRVMIDGWEFHGGDWC